MKKFLNSFTVLSLLAALTIGFTGCSEDDDNPITPTDPDVERPTNLRAYSDDGSVGLTWEPSTSESETNFGYYTIKVYDQSGPDTSTYVTQGKSNGAIVQGLTNGVIYEFFVYATTSAGKLSPAYAKVTWSPAVRHTQDDQGQVIRVYATTSSMNSGLDIHNDNGKAEVISQGSSEFAARGDLYLFAENSSSLVLELRTANNANVNPGPIATFSSFPTVEVDNLNEYSATSPPLPGTYTKSSISISDVEVSSGALYFGRLERGASGVDKFYFRMLVRKGSNNKLVQGSGDDRYVELEFSYQSTKNIQFAKRIN